MTRITTSAMHVSLASGAATALLPDGVPGPVSYDRQWWVIPHGETEYQPVTDPERATALDRHLERLAAGARALYHAQQAGGEQS